MKLSARFFPWLLTALMVSPFAAARAEGQEAKKDVDGPYEAMERLTEVMLLVRRHYAEELTYDEIAHAAIRGMLQDLDPHSAYMEPQAYEDMQDETSGHYSGIGIHIGMKEGALTVIAPIEDTPGFRAGLESGDRIVGINDEKTAGMDLRDAIQRLRGEEGTEVLLKIERFGEDEPRAITIVRDDIVVPSVKDAKLLDDGIGYVRVTHFSVPTAEALETSLDRLDRQGMRALILDLRSNPGGLLESAVGVSEMFLGAGDVIVTVKGRLGAGATVRRTAAGAGRFDGIPMVVLINGGAASASEIVAGALQDNGRAVLIGERTFGKGSVQSVIPLRFESDAAVRLTTARYHTPDGDEIHQVGIKPDLSLPVPPSEWNKVRIKRARADGTALLTETEGNDLDEELADVTDRQLDRAVEYLRAKLLARARDDADE